MISNNKKTKSTVALDALRQDIIRGIYPPDSRLQLADLKERYSVGYSPLREALFQLTTCGLVSIEEHCGFKVTPLSESELTDLYQTRSLIESQCLELSILHGDDNWESTVIASWHRFSKYLMQAKSSTIFPEQWDVLQSDYFHQLISACQSPWLLKINQLLSIQSERYRYACLNKNANNQKIIKDYLKDNEKLVRAVLSRNVEVSTSVLASIWNKSLKSIKSAFLK